MTLPKIVEAGQYWVCLEAKDTSSYCFRTGYCFKQRKTAEYSIPERDIGGSSNNANGYAKFDIHGKEESGIISWRFATEEEIAHYEKVGRPFDVRKLKNTSSKTKETLICTIL